MFGPVCLQHAKHQASKQKPLVKHAPRLIGVLTARELRKVNLCQLRGRETGSVAKDGRDTMHIIL